MTEQQMIDQWIPGVDATMPPTLSYRFIIVEKWHLDNGTKITKAHSCYMSYQGRKHGILLDYRTRDWAERALRRLQGEYAVVEV